jgi:hypothetical protein
VACIEEALELREAGIGKPILLLEGFFSDDELSLAASLDFWVMVQSDYQLAAIERAKLPQALNCWLKIDTGMHRLGFEPADSPALYQRLKQSTQVADTVVLATHFASSAFNPDCGSDDNAVCDTACPVGIEMGSCNAIEAVAELDRTAADADMQLIVGDLNKEIDDPRIQIITDAGFEDPWLTAGNLECGTASPDACTSGISGDSGLDGLDEPDQDIDSRIDFVLARPTDDCEIVADTPDDGDADGTPTGLFAVGPLDPPVNGLVWFSDHQGVMADIGLECT